MSALCRQPTSVRCAFELEPESQDSKALTEVDFGECMFGPAQQCPAMRAPKVHLKIF
jgi:hypothetical protein